MADQDAPQQPAPTGDRRQSEPLHKNAQFIVLMALLIVIFTLLLTLAFHQAPDPNRDLLNILLGAIVGSLGTGIQYFFGSNMASKAKDAALAAVTTKPTGGP